MSHSVYVSKEGVGDRFGIGGWALGGPEHEIPPWGGAINNKYTIAATGVQTLFRLALRRVKHKQVETCTVDE